MPLYLHGKKLKLEPHQAIGKGGEADVFDLGQGRVAKVFKQPSHPDYQGMPAAQQAAQQRLLDHQQKLRQFPQRLPERVIHPEDLLTDRSGQQILGYTMRQVQAAEVLLRYGDRRFRQAGIPHQTVVEIFRDLHTTMSKLHFAQVVIGDFNDLNVLVQDRAAYLIDADSFQYGSFLCPVFTARFVDPLLCDPQETRPLLQQPHSRESDWYAFTVMLMQCLLFVDPYGGIYRPKAASDRIPQTARPLKRITVFHPEVQYPKPALPYRVLPDELLHYFQQVFHQDQRCEFPLQLLEQLQWTTCTTCGAEHARACCPDCSRPAPNAVRQTTVVRGQVIATTVFRTEGTILQAAIAGQTLQWLSHDRQQFRRETGAIVLEGPLNPQLQIRLQGQATVLGQQGLLVTCVPGQAPTRLAVDSCGLQPSFDTNASCRYWVYNGQLLRDGQWGPEYIGDVLMGQTRFWVGSQFGFGFYRASSLHVAFVFDAQRRGLNDRVKLPAIAGQLVDATCVFSSDYCWFFTAVQDQGLIHHTCTVIRADGSLIATATAERGDGSWLGSLRGNCAAGHFLLAATDAGLVRVEPDQGQLRPVQTFPDTEPFVTADCQLLASAQGVYVVHAQTIDLLKLI